MTVTEKAWPVIPVAGGMTTSDAAAPWPTVIESLPVIEPVTVSVTVTVREPA